MKKKNKFETFTIETLGHIDYDFSELDFSLYEDLFKEDWDKMDDLGYHLTDFIINKRDYKADAHPISVDSLLKVLNEIKERGANYIAIDYNCDHIGYNIEPIIIRKATKYEIEQVEDLNSKKKSKQSRIDKLKSKIKEIENE